MFQAIISWLVTTMTMEDRINALEQRQSKLERHNKALKVALLGIVALSMIGARSITTGSFDIVEAEIYYLNDSEGERRAVLTTTSDGSPSLLFWDRDGTARAGMTAQEDLSGIWFNDETGQQRASLMHSENGTNLKLFDSIGSRRIMLQADGTNEILNFSNGSGASGLTIGSSADNTVMMLKKASDNLNEGIMMSVSESSSLINITDNDRRRVSLGTSERRELSFFELMDAENFGITVERKGDESSIKMDDAVGIEMWSAFAGRAGTGLNLNSLQGKPQILLRSTPEFGYLAFKDPQGVDRIRVTSTAFGEGPALQFFDDEVNLVREFTAAKD